MKKLKRRIFVGKGTEPGDLVFRNARVLDVFSGSWVKGDLVVVDGFIAGIGESYEAEQVIECEGRHLVPGFIDSHVHIESTMMLPNEFSRSVLPCGTTCAIWDPHEIANVFGIPGLEWALKWAESCPLDIFVMLSSCVPSSKFETSGAKISAAELTKLKNNPYTLGLAEMMNFPGVFNGETDVLEKIQAFSDKPIDGHSPLLSGKELNAYISAGIRTCHEICTLEEAREKLTKGMRVLIREGSVAKNARTLVPILSDYSSSTCMMCTDDRNPLDISDEGHLDYIIRIALESGISPEVAYRSVSFSTALHYGLSDRGALAPGYIADIVVLEDLNTAQIHSVFKNGISANDINWEKVDSPSIPQENSINVSSVPSHLNVKAPNKTDHVEVEVIEVVPGQIITNHISAKLSASNGIVQNSQDIQKIAIFERHHGTGNIGIGFVKGFTLKEGAIASSVAHDAHNIGIVGQSDEAMLAALDYVVQMGGGIVVVDGQAQLIASLGLPVAGLMSEKKYEEIIPDIKGLRNAVQSLGCTLEEPFLQMSFLALPVIPALKITDLGLVDVNKQEIIPIVRA